MFDHVTLRTSDLAATVAGLTAAIAPLGVEPPEDERLPEWDDLSYQQGAPATRGAHVALLAPDRAAVDAFWRAGVAAGLADDGAPGLREHYGEGYYGAFLRDADGNSIEACRHPNSVDGSIVDHVWLRVRDVAASRDFYAALTEWTGFALERDEPGFAHFRGPEATLSLVAGEPLSAHLHMAFPGADDATVDGFHAAALAAGGRDNGGPGERPQYHPGYYAAFVLDPDGHNVEVVDHNR